MTWAALDRAAHVTAIEAPHCGAPVLNVYGLKDGSEKVLGKGYNILMRRGEPRSRDDSGRSPRQS